ncbi:unnamed protein product, partial [Ranitomeya imitator]
ISPTAVIMTFNGTWKVLTGSENYEKNLWKKWVFNVMKSKNLLHMIT